MRICEASQKLKVEWSRKERLLKDRKLHSGTRGSPYMNDFDLQAATPQTPETAMIRVSRLKTAQNLVSTRAWPKSSTSSPTVRVIMENSTVTRYPQCDIITGSETVASVTLVETLRGQRIETGYRYRAAFPENWRLEQREDVVCHNRSTASACDLALADLKSLVQSLILLTDFSARPEDGQGRRLVEPATYICMCKP